MNISQAGNALFLAEDALHTLFENVDPQFTLFEGMNIKKLVDSANDHRDPNDNYRMMTSQVDPVWRVEPKKGVVTITFFFKSTRIERNPDAGIDLSDAKDVHRPEIQFSNMTISETPAIDWRELKGRAREKAKKEHQELISMFVPKDPDLDVERWRAEHEDNFETPEDMEQELAKLFDRYYVSPITSASDIAVRCTCLDYHYTYYKANKIKGAHFGKATIGDGRDRTGTGKPRNPDMMPGYCGHIRYAMEMLAADPLFWQTKVKLYGSKKHRVDSDDIGVWADASGY